MVSYASQTLQSMKLIGINDSIHSIEVKADFLNAIYTKLLNINIILYKEDKLSQSSYIFITPHTAGGAPKIYRFFFKIFFQIFF